MSTLSLLIVEVFARYKRWIPSLISPGYPVDREVILMYRDEIYRISDPSIVQWLQHSRYDIPTSIFYDIMGDYPDVLPSISITPTSVLDMMVISIVSNYIGLYSITWDMQILLYKNRDKLPLHWQQLGGISVNRYDPIHRKWNGDPSPYRKSQYNGLYIPYGLSSMIGERYIVGNDDDRYRYPVINDVSFSIVHRDPIDQKIIDRISIEMTGRHPIITTLILSDDRIDILEDMDDTEISNVMTILGLDIPMDDGSIHLIDAIDSIIHRLSTM